MESFENIMRGSVRAEVVGLDMEAFLNLCARQGVEFWDLRRTAEGSLQMNFTLRGWRRAKVLAEKAMCEITPLRRSGLPVLLRRVKARFVLLAGLIACVLGLAVLSMFVWEIEIQGESVVPDAVILRALEEAGAGIGAFGQSLDSELLRSRLLLELPELKWISINVFGSRAVVSVRDRTPPPEMVDMTSPGDLVARVSGLVERVEVYEGKALVKPGSTVLAGETLASGRMDSLSSGERQVHALGEIYARTWYTFSAQLPLEVSAKAYDGRVFTRRALYIGGKRLNLYFNAGVPLDDYDKIIERKSLSLSGGFTFPISLVTERCRAYDCRRVELSAEEAEALLRAELAARLEDRLGEGGEVLKQQFSAKSENGVYTLTLQAECLENIAEEAPLSGAGEETELD